MGVESFDDEFLKHATVLELDVRGLLCPEPVMMLHQMVRSSTVGDVIKVLATDPSTQRDIPKFCHFLNHQLLAQTQEHQLYTYYIKCLAKVDT